MPDLRTVISNTSPLFYLQRIHSLDLLRLLYTRICVTSQVLAELAAGGMNASSFSALGWFDIRDVRIPEALSLVPDLGAGEASIIALALESALPSLILIDDRLGRQIAALNHLKITGTAGVLLKAKQQGFVKAVKPLLEELHQIGFYLKPQHLAEICDLAGE